MMSPKLLAAAAIVASTLASPAFAQTVTTTDPGYRAQRAGSVAAQPRYRHPRMARREMYRENRGTGFWPADAAGAVAGAAVGTAAAIATAPFRGWENSYAYDGTVRYDRGSQGWYGDWNTYASRNGIVCRPGTMFKGADGQQHFCQ